jgi:hypothetical protein
MITGLSAATLEYLIIAMVVTYPILAMVQRKLPTGFASSALGYLLKVLPFVEVEIRKAFTKAKTEALPPPEAPPPA